MNVIKAIENNIVETTEYGVIRITVDKISDVPKNYKRYIYEYDEGLDKYIVHKIMSIRQAVNVICNKYRSGTDIYMRATLLRQHVHGFHMEDLINLYGECLERETNNKIVCLEHSTIGISALNSMNVEYDECNLDDYI